MNVVRCILTEMWLPITGIWYRAFWQKCDSQSQGFGTVHSDRNVTANHRDLVLCSLAEIWLQITGIWYRAFWQKCDSQSQGFGTVQSGRNMTANHRDLVPCNLTEIWLPITGIWYCAFWQKYDCQSQGFGTVHCDRNVTANHRDLVRLLWQKYDCQSQGFGTVQSGRNVTANHGNLVKCNPTEIWEFITGMCSIIFGFLNHSSLTMEQQVSPNVSFSQTICGYIRKYGILHRHCWKKLKSYSIRFYWTVTPEDDWELQM